MSLVLVEPSHDSLVIITRVLVHQSLINLKLSWLKLACHYQQQRVLSLEVALQVQNLHTMEVVKIYF